MGRDKMKEDGEEKKKKSWRGRGRSNEWMTDATDRSPLTEQTRRGNCHVLPGCPSPPPRCSSLLFPTVAARPVPSQPFRFHTPGKAGRVTIFVCPSRPSVASVLPIRASPADIHRVITIASELLSRMFCLIIRKRRISR